ncbi:MAG: hypothetical protein NC350_04845 [Corallococcus sp.]|nr:hypothetical protein [Corallococcus sp.]
MFKKINADPASKKGIIKNYCLRIIKLYLFWLVVFLPVLVYRFVISSHKVGVSETAVVLTLKFLFLGVYDGAWYLVSSIVGVLIINRLAKYSLKTNFAVAIAFYLIACLFSSYFNVFSYLPDTGFGGYLKTALKYINGNYCVYLSFLNCVLYVLIGRCFGGKGNAVFRQNQYGIAYSVPVFDVRRIVFVIVRRA